jgi:serine/threonine protein kinase
MRERTEPILQPGRDAPAEEQGGSSLRSASTIPSSAAGAVEEVAWSGRILAGRYELGAVLGRGGMGVVYEARHIALGRSVALKVLRRDLARSSEAVARFHREARAAASIRSPHVVEVFDFGFTEEGDAYIAMERLHGVDLRRLVQTEGPLDPARAVAIARQIARGLASAHAQGIVHRDLKSENVIVSDRDAVAVVKILDFGISKIAEFDEGGSPLTSEGVVMGTPHYMAPELLRGADLADARADLYALGCVLYELLTGTLPFSGRTAMEVAYKHVHEPVEPPSARRPDLGSTFDSLARAALEKDVTKRIPSAERFLLALDALVLGPPPSASSSAERSSPATPPSPPPPSAQPPLPEAAPAKLETKLTHSSGADLLPAKASFMPTRGGPRRALLIAATVAAIGAGALALAPWGSRGSSSVDNPVSVDAAPSLRATTSDVVEAIVPPAQPPLDASVAVRAEADRDVVIRGDSPGDVVDRLRGESTAPARSERTIVTPPNLEAPEPASTRRPPSGDAGTVTGLMLPEGPPRGPDDGLKHSPYGSNR